MNEITTSLARALDRIDDFEAVQSDRSAEELFDAVVLLQKSVGIGDETRALIRDRLEAIGGARNGRGHVLLGLIVGLTAAELEAEAA